MPIAFPLATFPAGTFQAMLLGSDETGGAALGGPGQVVDWSAGGLWVAELTGIQLWEPDHIRLYRAVLMACRGGGEIDVPIIDDPQRPFPEGLDAAAPAPFDDGTFFSDGTGHVGDALSFVVQSAAVEGDASLTVRRVVGAPLRGGEYFTLDHDAAGPRAYCVETVTDEDDDAVFQIAFGSGLREDVAAGTAIDFERPRCRMRLLTPWSEAWPRLTPPFEAEVALRFVESFAHL